MSSKKQLIIWIAGFLSLNIYTNLLPSLFTFQLLDWFAYWIGFFLLAFLLARYVLKLKGLASFGLNFRKGYFFALGIGFLLGLFIWAIKYLSFYSLGMFQVTGLMDASYIFPMLAQALLAMFFASAINDLMIRGYWLPFLKKENLMNWYIVITTFLYTLDDCWHAGVDLINLVFSAILGISLAYTVFKTRAIWMCLGIHWGSNMMYRIMYGFNGQGIWKLENVTENVLFDYVSLFITALLFPILYWILKVFPWQAGEQEKEQQLFPARKMA
jgi:hypothetical protein